MSREIKFRIWDKKSKKTRNVESIGFGIIGLSTKGYPVVNALGRNCIENEDILIHRENGEYELMQYIGLKDKNKVRVFEGDVIKFNYNDKEVYSAIEYSMGVYGVLIKGKCFEYTDFWTMTDLVGYVGSNFEVVGNIYENKELLEREE